MRWNIKHNREESSTRYVPKILDSTVQLITISTLHSAQQKKNMDMSSLSKHDPLPRICLSFENFFRDFSCMHDLYHDNALSNGSQHRLLDLFEDQTFLHLCNFTPMEGGKIGYIT